MWYANIDNIPVLTYESNDFFLRLHNVFCDRIDEYIISQISGDTISMVDNIS